MPLKIELDRTQWEFSATKRSCCLDKALEEMLCVEGNDEV